MANLVQIPTPQTPQAWPLVRERVEHGCRGSDGRFTPEALFKHVVDGNYDLHIVWADEDEGHDDQVRAVVLTQVYEELSGEKVCSIIFLDGMNADDWLVLGKESLELWAMQNGCQRVEGWMRKGWARKLKDYKLTHVLLEKRLDG